jgi:predicted enzyme related to lactoylglutathione lyase
MQVTGYEHGVPSWVDLATPDPSGAADFYGRLFGWEAPPGTAETGGYRNATLRDLTVAGIGPQPQPGPPVWSAYVNVDSADDVAARVAENGGTVVVPPMDVMGFGRMAVFTDPGGAFFSVWQAGSHYGAQVVSEPGSLCWTELITDDLATAVDFYAKVLGWVAGGGAGYTEVEVNGRVVAGMMARPPGMPADIPPYWGVYFAVSDLDATIAAVTDLGGQVHVPPTDTPAGRFATVSDPQGAAFNVIQLENRPDRP